MTMIIFGTIKNSKMKKAIGWGILITVWAVTIFLWILNTIHGGWYFIFCALGLLAVAFLIILASRWANPSFVFSRYLFKLKSEKERRIEEQIKRHATDRCEAVKDKHPNDIFGYLEELQQRKLILIERIGNYNAPFSRADRFDRFERDYISKIIKNESA